MDKNIYNPIEMRAQKRIVLSLFVNKIEYASSPINCLKDADCCIIVTEWNEFKKLTPEDYK